MAEPHFAPWLLSFGAFLQNNPGDPVDELEEVAAVRGDNLADIGGFFRRNPQPVQARKNGYGEFSSLRKLHKAAAVTAFAAPDRGCLIPFFCQLPVNFDGTAPEIMPHHRPLPFPTVSVLSPHYITTEAKKPHLK